MKLSTPQRKVADDQARFRVLVTGRRFGKTTLAIRELCYYARIPDKLVWMICPSYRQAKQIAWVKLKNILKDLKWVRKVNEAELTIELKNGSRICLRGADNKDSLRGVGIDFMVLDECADIDETAWTEVLRPTLSDTKGSAVFCGTPKGMNWFHDLYQRGQDPSEQEWSSYQFTTLDGGFVEATELEQAKKDLDVKTFRQEYQATWETYSGIIYYGFSMSENIKHFVEPIDNNILHIGMDFNLDPMSAVVTYIDKGVVYIKDEIQIWSSNTDEMCAEIHRRYPGKKIFVYPDPASRQRKTSAGGRTDLSILMNAGFICKVPGRHMAVRDRINSVNAKLCSANNERQVFFNPKVKNCVNSISKNVFKEGTMLPDKTQGFDHMNDALGYLISFLYPIRTTYETEQPQRYTVKTGVAH
tara:strand:+ start:364 stop:1608 length:1245 start_codon:yes stop_codon:yes gene_type:complete